MQGSLIKEFMLNERRAFSELFFDKKLRAIHFV